MSVFSTFDEAEAYLLGTIDETVSRRTSYNLDRMHALLRELGDPHRQYPTIHVGGTSGKGSTCTMICRRAAGRRQTDGAAYETASPPYDRTRAYRRHRDRARALRTAPRRNDAGDRARCGRTRTPHLLRDVAGAVVRPLRRRTRRRGGDRSRTGRTPRRHQRVAAGGYGDHVDRIRPHRSARRDARGDRARKSRYRARRRAVRRRSRAAGSAGHARHLRACGGRTARARRRRRRRRAGACAPTLRPHLHRAHLGGALRGGPSGARTLSSHERRDRDRRPRAIAAGAAPRSAKRRERAGPRRDSRAHGNLRRCAVLRPRHRA